MIHSMTGYGEARTSLEGVTYRVEIRSVNNRYFKATIKLPEPFQRFEAHVDKLLKTRLGRGSISFSLRIKDDSPVVAGRINATLLDEYARELSAVGKRYPEARLDLSRLLDAPGVLQEQDIDEDRLAVQYRTVESLANRAMDGVVAMRKAEGEALLRDMLERCAELRARLAQVQKRSPSVVADYQKRLQSRVQQLLDGMDGVKVDLHEDTLAREVAIFAERCDVNEELSRLASHLDQFAALCQSPEESGRKLDFLAQELLREANTIGSKSNDAEIAKHVVEMKAAIDRIKEQVQNVE
ncbi:MAG TPA: YicC/YloC family endoribonuclease [Phycisphaerae bacterium]|nr:YicC/YloC family endoribonuclease [Phycisphaerae bacterium]